MPKKGDREFRLDEKTDLFFHDYSIGPLFVQENYPYVKLVGPKLVLRFLWYIYPISPARTHIDVLSALSQTADAISEGDIVSNIIRGGSQWPLLPIQVMHVTHDLVI